MAAPQINPKTSLLVARVGESFSFQLAAFESPTTWTALHLPAGFSINASTGLISAANPTVPGLYQVAVRASKVEEATTVFDDVFLLISVLDAELDEENMGGWNDLLVDFDLTTRKVSLHFDTEEQRSALLSVADGDNFDVLVGFYRYGILRDVNPGSEDVYVKLALKEFEPEILLSLEGGTPEKVVVGNSTRYRVSCYIDPKTWQPVLSNYEDDEKTALEAPSEIELSVETQLYTETKSVYPFTIKGNMIGVGGNPVATKSLSFTNLDEETKQAYELLVSMNVSGHPTQNLLTQFTLDIEKSGGNWSASNIVPSLPKNTTGLANDDWVATLETSSATGNGSGITLGFEVSSSAGANLYAFEFDLTGQIISGTLGSGSFYLQDDTSIYLYDNSSSIGSAVLENPDGNRMDYNSLDDFFSVVESLVNTIVGSSEVVEVRLTGSNTFRIYLLGSTNVRGVEIEIGGNDGNPNGPSIYPNDGLQTTATISATLTQITGIGQKKYTGQFKTEVMRSLVD